jgi:hypothetical protein
MTAGEGAYQPEADLFQPGFSINSKAGSTPVLAV